MKLFSNKIVTVLLLLIIIPIISLYVYVGTYLLPIAPHWVTQLPPNPPVPFFLKSNFEFNITYTIDGNIVAISDSVVCEFEGFKVAGLGDVKTREYKSYINDSNTKALLNEAGNVSAIVLYEDQNNLLVFRCPSPEYLMGEKNHSDNLDTPTIRILDKTTGYYLSGDDEQAYLNNLLFNVKEWNFTTPIKNYFIKYDTILLFIMIIVVILLFFRKYRTLNLYHKNKKS